MVKMRKLGWFALLFLFSFLSVVWILRFVVFNPRSNPHQPLVFRGRSRLSATNCRPQGRSLGTATNVIVLHPPRSA